MRAPVVQPVALIFAVPVGAAEIEGPLRIFTLAVISIRFRMNTGLGEGAGVAVGQGVGVGTGVGVGVGRDTTRKNWDATYPEVASVKVTKQ